MRRKGETGDGRSRVNRRGRGEDGGKQMKEREKKRVAESKKCVQEREKIRDGGKRKGEKRKEGGREKARERKRQARKIITNGEGEQGARGRSREGGNCSSQETTSSGSRHNREAITS